MCGCELTAQYDENLALQAKHLEEQRHAVLRHVEINNRRRRRHRYDDEHDGEHDRHGHRRR